MNLYELTKDKAPYFLKVLRTDEAGRKTLKMITLKA